MFTEQHNSGHKKCDLQEQQKHDERVAAEQEFDEFTQFLRPPAAG